MSGQRRRAAVDDFVGNVDHVARTMEGERLYRLHPRGTRGFEPHLQLVVSWCKRILSLICAIYGLMRRQTGANQAALRGIVMRRCEQYEIRIFVQGVFLFEQLQAHYVATHQIDICNVIICLDSKFLVFCLPGQSGRDGVAGFLLRRRRCLRWYARARHARLSRTLLSALRHGRDGRTMLLLPGIPKKQQRERKHEKQNKSLRIHWGSGNRVITAGMPGMAACNALEREPTAEPGAVFVYRLHRIVRARRKKTATGSQQRAKAVAVSLDQD